MFNVPPAINPRSYQSKGQKLGIFVVLVLLLMIVLVSGFTAVGTLASIIGGRARDTNLIPSLVGAAICAIGCFGLIKLVPLFRRPVDFLPRLGDIPAGASGSPFDVRLQRKTMGPAFSGQGVVQFFPDHLTIEGHREINSYIQFGIFVVVSILPLVLFVISLGVIPAALLAKYVGRKKIVQTVPYETIRSIKLEGNLVTIECPSLSTSKIVFYVASADGARLHGEIHPRFAALFQGVAAGLPR